MILEMARMVVSCSFKDCRAALEFLKSYVLSRPAYCQKLAFCVFLVTSLNTEVLAQSVERGREVYIQEGCINCHSQFVRPGTRDEEMWGPYVEKEKILAGIPPLIGNRRMGPDLLNVASRRSAEWLELHMIYPQELSPDSRMPQYGYLFKDGRGKDLVEYLKSLGAETISERTKYVYSWKIGQESDSLEMSKKLYSKTCAQCHYLEGGHESGGQAAKLLSVQPRDFKTQKFIYINKDSLDDLARAIKFGIYGTSMPGHEYLSDKQVMGLAKYVQTLIRSN